MGRRVVVTGSGVISALGDAPDGVFEALRKGTSGLRPIQLFDTAGLRCKQGGEISDFSPQTYLGEANLRPLDRTSRLAVAAAQQTLVAGGWSVDMLQRHEVGLVLGTLFCSIHTIGEFDRRGLTEGPEYVKPLDFANTVINAASGQTAIWHNLRGINSTIATGVSSGLQALAYATDLIRSGRETALLAGGAEELCFESFFGFDRAGLLCGSDPHNGDGEYPIPFDARRNGFAPGEAAAFLLLEDAEAAAARQAPVLAEIKGHGRGYDNTCGKDHSTAVAVLERTIRLALQDAGMAPEAIDCVSAAANGSVREDAVEALALARVFGAASAELPVTAVKSMLGETLGASGPLQALTLLAALERGVLPGIHRLEQLEENFPLALSPDSRELDLRTGLVNALGFDGNSCALVLARADAEVS
jgi:3-oxoacyl-[acyl-carrier-protein] synthase II